MRPQPFVACLRAGWLFAFAALWLSAAGRAQDAPPTAGTVGDTLKPPPVVRPLPPAPIEAPTPDSRTPPVAAGGRRVTVERFRFSGNTLFEEAELSALLDAYRGRPVTLYELYEAADTVTAHYVERGYTLSAVALPAQRIDGGEVRFEVIEGRIGKIRAEGNRRYQENHLRAYLDELRPGDIYRSDTLSDGLRQLNELPGLSIRALVEPGSRYGSSDIVLKAEETAFSGGVFIDNHGRETIGEYRAAVDFTLNNPTRTEDQLHLLALGSEDGLLTYGLIEYAVPLNFQGPRLRLSYSQADFEVGEGPFTDLVEGTNHNASAALEWPLIRQRNERLMLVPAVRGTDADTDQFGLITRGTRLTVLDIGLRYSRAFANRSLLQLQAGVSSNFGSQSREDLQAIDAVGTDQKFRAEVDLQQITPLWRQYFLYTRLAGVWSPEPLVDTEQMSLGGPNSVRGYPAAEARGDRGYFATVGIDRHFAAGPVGLDARAFLDAGSVYLVDAPAGVDSKTTLASIGIGGDLSLPAGFLLRLDLAVPIGAARDEISDGRDSGRVFGTLSYRF